MFGDLQRDVFADPAQFALEALVDERLELPAAVADHVVVVPASVADRLVAYDALTDLDPHHQLGLFELLEDPVDARARHRSILAFEGGADLDR